MDTSLPPLTHALEEFFEECDGGRQHNLVKKMIDWWLSSTRPVNCERLIRWLMANTPHESAIDDDESKKAQNAVLFAGLRKEVMQCAMGIPENFFEACILPIIESAEEDSEEDSEDSVGDDNSEGSETEESEEEADFVEPPAKRRC
jgi:hypothetical protein